MINNMRRELDSDCSSVMRQEPQSDLTERETMTITISRWQESVTGHMAQQ